MNMKISYEQEFVDLFNKLHKKYPDKLFDIDGIGKQLDVNFFSKKLFSIKSLSEASVDSNANVTETTPAAYVNELPKPFLRLNSYYLLWKYSRYLYDTNVANKLIEHQLNGDVYINDYHGFNQPYCFNYSTLDIVVNGLPFVKKINTIPPKYLYSFKSQLEQFIAYASNSIMGATGIADLLIVMSWFIDKILKTKSDAGFSFKSENDIWKYVKETIVSFIYTINQPFRSGIQSSFTNISLYDDLFLNTLVKEYVFPDGKHANKSTIKKLQELFVDIMNQEHKRTPITFPVTTACFSVDDNNNILDKEFLKFIAKKNLNFGFINIYVGKTSTLSSCCRLRSNTDNPYFNSFGTGSGKIGSFGVCTLNLPRLATKYKHDKKMFMKELKYMIEIATKVNNTKRFLLKRRIIDGFMPLYTLNFMTLNNQYSTIGLNGINEVVEIFGMQINDDNGKNLVKEIMELVNNEIDKYQQKYDYPHNVEQVPAEAASVKLAKKDKVLGYNNKYDLYSNQFIPLTVNANMLERIDLQGAFDKYFTGGSILHINADQQINDVKKMEQLIEYSAKRGVIYFAINYNLQKCVDGHFTVGTNEKCSVCNKPIIDNYTRVVGFLVNTKNFNPTRQKKDYPNRKWYKNINTNEESKKEIIQK